MVLIRRILTMLSGRGGAAPRGGRRGLRRRRAEPAPTGIAALRGLLRR